VTQPEEDDRNAPTLEEVARVAGVSRSTVSRVVNGLPNVSRRSRESVARAIASLGYIPNQAARTLATRRTNSIALVVSEHGNRVFGDPFFAGVLRGVYAGLAGSQRQLVLLMGQEADSDRLLTYLCGGHVDGALMVSLHGRDPLPQRVAEAGVPVVFGGRPLSGANVPCVDSDNFHGGWVAARHLVSIGRTRIATIAGPEDMAVGIDRFVGWRRGMAEAGRDTGAVVRSDFTIEAGAAADIIAVGAMRTLISRGRSIPDDVAVVGFDDSVLATSVVPPLTTVRQPIEELGRTMTWRLLAQLAGEDDLPASVLLPTELVRRESA